MIVLVFRVYQLKYPSDKYRFDKLEGSLAFRCINKNNKNCLIINSDLGNIPDFFSDIFEEVVSLDTPEKILIQKARFETKKITNVVFETTNSDEMHSIEKNYDCSDIPDHERQQKGVNASNYTKFNTN